MPAFRSYFVFLSLFLPFMLGGCELAEGFQESFFEEESVVVTPSEELLAEDAHWSIVADDAPSLDPLVQHMEARGEVHPERLSNVNKHVKKIDEMHEDEASHFRVLRLEAADAGNAAIVKEEVIVVADTAPAAAPLEVKRESGVKVSNPLPGRIGVKKVRVGEHPGKTRFVLDVGGDAAFATWLQDSDHVLIVNILDAKLDGAHGRVLDAHPLIKAYGFQTDDTGAVQFIVTFKKSARLAFKAMMAPNDAYPDHRIVLDVVKK